MKVEVVVLDSPVPNSPYGLCGRKAKLNSTALKARELCERRGGRPGLPSLTVLMAVKGLTSSFESEYSCSAPLTLRGSKVPL